ncbi:hypothetical protein BDV96DRAFT_300850 [Lophiotrema nucula]|uniref:F-box domain-containing protein n=1 Tax=Lophiotrema nucula TaxID=690887 RepID=A0A6A5YK02_9PLEO|nr:hypothetical protein BDV96DRAFT_300850 [Lophiotrema nucula]
MIVSTTPFSTTMASFPGFNNLPTELLLQIVRHLEVSCLPSERIQNLVNFARSAKACVAPAQELLFRTCDLTKRPPQATQLLRTLLYRPELGTLVRSIKIVEPASDLDRKEYYTALVPTVVDLLSTLGLESQIAEQWIRKIKNLDADAWTALLLLLTPDAQHVELRANKSITSFLRKLNDPQTALVTQSIEHLILADIEKPESTIDQTQFFFGASKSNAQLPRRHASSELSRRHAQNSRFTSLQTLEVHSNELATRSINQLTNFVLPQLFQSSGVTKFALNGWVAPHVMSSALSKFTNLQSFAYDIEMPQPGSVSQQQYRSLADLVPALSPLRDSLETLELHVHAKEDYPDFWPQDLENFTSLKHFGIFGGFSLRPPISQINDLHIEDFLPPTLEHLVIDPTVQASGTFRGSWAFEPLQYGMKALFVEKDEMAPELKSISLGPRLLGGPNYVRLALMASSVGIDLHMREPSVEESNWDQRKRIRSRWW